MKGLLKSLFNDFKAITGNDGGWVWAIPAAMAAMGAITGAEKEKQARKQNRAAATQTEFSPWTGMGKGQLVDGGAGPLAGAIQGGVSGLGMAQGMGGFQGAQAAQGTNSKWSDLMNSNNTVQTLQNQGANMTSDTFSMPKKNQWSMGGGTASSLYA